MIYIQNLPKIANITNAHIKQIAKNRGRCCGLFFPPFLTGDYPSNQRAPNRGYHLTSLDRGHLLRPLTDAGVQISEYPHWSPSGTNQNEFIFASRYTCNRVHTIFPEQNSMTFP